MNNQEFSIDFLSLPECVQIIFFQNCDHETIKILLFLNKYFFNFLFFKCPNSIFKFLFLKRWKPNLLQTAVKHWMRLYFDCHNTENRLSKTNEIWTYQVEMNRHVCSPIIVDLIYQMKMEKFGRKEFLIEYANYIENFDKNIAEKLYQETIQIVPNKCWGYFDYAHLLFSRIRKVKQPNEQDILKIMHLFKEGCRKDKGVYSGRLTFVKFLIWKKEMESAKQEFDNILSDIFNKAIVILERNFRFIKNFCQLLKIFDCDPLSIIFIDMLKKNNYELFLYIKGLLSFESNKIEEANKCFIQLWMRRSTLSVCPILFLLKFYEKTNNPKMIKKWCWFFLSYSIHFPIKFIKFGQRVFSKREFNCFLKKILFFEIDKNRIREINSFMLN